ncbi:MAG: hypothetical protein LBM02_08040 [Lachnospiraceae bacterium]|nr:hypothetical protein [Lachnospiraceae bacterium]
MSETSKVFKSGQGARVATIPVLIRKNLGIDIGDTLEWNLDSKTDELVVRVIKAVD